MQDIYTHYLMTGYLFIVLKFTMIWSHIELR